MGYQSSGLWVKCPGTNEKRVHTRTRSAQFSARVQGLDLVLGHGARARFLARALEKKCVHISAQQESYSGTSARAPSVKTALSAKMCPGLFCGPLRRLVQHVDNLILKQT